MFYACSVSLHLILQLKSFFKALWHPYQNLDIANHKKSVLIIILVGIFFGAAHIISGEPWSNGKFAQAAVSGIIIGWVYYRYGLITAILIHWATNYFIFSYVFTVSEINGISIENAISHVIRSYYTGSSIVTVVRRA